MKKILYFGFALVLVGIFSISAYAADNDLKAMVISIKGDVKVDPQGKGKWVAAENDMDLGQGAILKAGAASSADLVFDKAMLNVVNVGENTTLAVDLLSHSLTQVSLPNGKILAKLKGLKNGAKFQVRTPTAICGARGTGLGVEVFEGITNVQAFEDVIYVQGLGPNGEPLSVTVEVPAGWKSAIKTGENPTPPAGLTANELQVWNTWVSAVAKMLAETEKEAEQKSEQEFEQEAEQPTRPEGSKYD
ncbi:MAG: FecR domain-containing protein [Candidatus Omnitrophota bacterium]|jgi:hypothetical protein